MILSQALGKVASAASKMRRRTGLNLIEEAAALKIGRRTGLNLIEEATALKIGRRTGFNLNEAGSIQLSTVFSLNRKNSHSILCFIYKD